MRERAKRMSLATVLAVAYLGIVAECRTRADALSAAAARSGAEERVASSLPGWIASACDVPTDGAEARRIQEGLRPLLTTDYVHRRLQRGLRDVEGVFRHGAPSVEFTFGDVRQRLLELGVRLNADALEPVEIWATELRPAMRVLRIFDGLTLMLAVAGAGLLAGCGWLGWRRGRYAILGSLLRDAGALSLVFATALCCAGAALDGPLAASVGSQEDDGPDLAVPLRQVGRQVLFEASLQVGLTAGVALASGVLLLRRDRRLARGIDSVDRGLS